MIRYLLIFHALIFVSIANGSVLVIPDTQEIKISEAKELGILVEIKEDNTIRNNYIKVTVQLSQKSETIFNCYSPSIISLSNYIESTYFMTEVGSIPITSGFRLKQSDLSDYYFEISLIRKRVDECNSADNDGKILRLTLKQLI